MTPLLASILELACTLFLIAFASPKRKCAPAGEIPSDRRRTVGPDPKFVQSFQRRPLSAAERLSNFAITDRAFLRDGSHDRETLTT